MIAPEDRLAITEVMSKYALFIDTRRTEEWEALFEDDSIIEIDGRPPIDTAEGRRKLIQGSPRGVHLAAAPIIRDGPATDSAVAEQTFMFHNLVTGASLAGWYEDTLVEPRRPVVFPPTRAPLVLRAAEGAPAGHRRPCWQQPTPARASECVIPPE